MKKYITIILVMACFLLCGCMGNKNTSINGQDISGLSREEATQKISQIAKKQQEEIEIILNHKDKQFILNGSDFNIDFNSLGNSLIKSATANVLENFLGNKNQQLSINNTDLILGLDEKIKQIAFQIDCEPTGGEVIFDQENNFQVTDTKDGVVVNQEILKQQILKNLQTKNKFELNIPTIIKTGSKTKQEIEKITQKRSVFSTDYTSSTNDRKYNVKLALSAFNGMKIEPGQEVSFNDVVSTKINDNDFKTAKIILNGEFVDGKGGGICQASTTLYNALILSDIQIKEVHSHSLPVNYVPLGFDAMVNHDRSDLKFVNNMNNPIYLKTWGDDKSVYVEVWGEPFEEGKNIKIRSDIIGKLPHPGDKIVSDTEGKYSNKITFKGEYFRAKLPQEGYEAKAFIEYIIDGDVVEEKQIRHEYYNAQYGIIYEGTEELIEGITLPENKVKFIPPQK